MTDFETLARRAVDEPVLPPSDPERIRRRAAVLRRRRRAGVGLVSAVVIATAATLVWVSVPGRPASQQVMTAPTTPTTATTLPRGWRRASAAEVDAFAARGSKAGPDYLATWSVVLVGSPHGRSATVVSGQDAHEWFYELTPASVFGELLAPPGLAGVGEPGTSYAYYLPVGTNRPAVNCSTTTAAPREWRCVSWAGLEGLLGMSDTSELQSPYPPYSASIAVSESLFSFGYRGGPGPAVAAYISHRRELGLNLTCLRFGSVTQPVGGVCADPHGLITSYRFSAKVVVDGDTGTRYLAVTLTGYQPNPPARLLEPPATPTEPVGQS